MKCDNCLIDPICTQICYKRIPKKVLLEFLNDDRRCIRLCSIALKDYKQFYIVENNTVIIFCSSINFCRNNKLHRDKDKPAIITLNGNKVWCKNGKYHRSNDKPAIIYAKGDQCWYKNGNLHRDGGKPAIIFSDGTMEWWENGKRIK